MRVAHVCVQDDAAGRRLGNGAKFYGKRRSSFYGEEDANRKTDPDAFDAEEDWRGPQGGSYFVRCLVRVRLRVRVRVRVSP